MTEEAARRDPGALDFRDGVVAFVLIVLPVAVYSGAIAQLWTGDDTQILKHALSHPLAAVFTVPAVWRELSWLYFTPLVDVSTRLDAALFGLAPAGWYVHHLAVMGIDAALLYLLMRGWLPRAAAALAALLFLTGPPLAEVSRQLWSRHYVEGLAWALVSLLLFRRAVPRGSGPWALAAGAAGLAAMLGKEVFAAVPLVALALPWGTLRNRLRAAIPLLLALAGYLAWRNSMVGYWGGVGRGGKSLLDPLRRAAFQLALFPDLVLGVWPAAGLALFALALVLLRPTRTQTVTILLVLGAVLAPLSVLSDPPAGRYAIVPMAALAAFLAAAVTAGWSSGGPRRWFAALLAAALLIPALAAGRATFGAAGAAAARGRAETLFYTSDSGPGDVLYRPVEPAWYFEGLDWLRDRSGAAHGSSVVYDAVALCDRAPSTRLFAYDAASGAVRGDLPGPAAELAAACARLDLTLPLAADLSYRESTLTWRLGPEQGGTWAFLSGESASPLDVPREGSRFILLSGDVKLRLRHERPDGRLGLSPLLTLHVEGGRGTLVWKR